MLNPDRERVLERIIALLAVGFTEREVAMRLRVSRSTIQQAIRLRKATGRAPLAADDGGLELPGCNWNRYPIGRCRCGAKARLIRGRCMLCQLMEQPAQPPLPKVPDLDDDDEQRFRLTPEQLRERCLEAREGHATRVYIPESSEFNGEWAQ